MNGSTELTVTPLQQVRRVRSGNSDSPDDLWRIVGNDAAFKCSWDSPGPLQGGWYVMTVALEVSRGRVCNPCLYPDYGAGFGESDKVELALDVAAGERGEVREQIVRFTRDTHGLRFDPTVVPAEFALSTIQLRRIGKIEAARRIMAEAMRGLPALGRAALMTTAVSRLLTRGPSSTADSFYNSNMASRSVAHASDYNAWLEFYEASGTFREHIAQQVYDSLQTQPLVSILLPTYNTPELWLRKCIDSVRDQSYVHWQLCIADDASTQPHVRHVIAEYAALDERIRYVFRPENGHISAASNSALAIADGEFIALVDHDDELHPMALLECIKAFERNPAWQMLYTDEDKIDTEGRRSDPYFKSDWNPELFLSQNCVCHLTVYRTARVMAAGGFKHGMEGAQDWDLTLRVTEGLQASEIGHVRKVLYHWRMIPGSTASAPGEKSYAHMAAYRALQGHLDRVGGGSKVLEMPSYSGYFRIAHQVPDPKPLVSLLIPTRDRIDLLKRCIDSILKLTEYPNFEIIVMDNDSREQETIRYFREVQGDLRVRVVAHPHPFNYSAINNAGAQLARGSVLGLLNNDVEVISADWLDEMVAHAIRPEIGVVGAMLYYPNDTIQHAGVILGVGGVAGHCYVGAAKGYPGHKHRAGLTQALSAVTAACAIVRTSVFREVGGLDEELKVAFNDIDFCLRVRERGYRNVWTPFAELYHHESATRGYENTPAKIDRFKKEEQFMKDRWGGLLLDDPYYNPNFALNSTPFTLAYPPRES